MGISGDLCARCKGVRRMCGLRRCPILLRIEEEIRLEKKIRGTTINAATPPSVLVGEVGYPIVRVGPNITPVTGIEAKIYDNPESWWGAMSIEDIIKLRAGMVYSNLRLHVKSIRRPESRLLEVVKEISMSEKPVDTECILKRPPRFHLKFNTILKPRGPVAPLRKLSIVSNPVIPRRVDYLVDDYDVRAFDAVNELYTHGVSIYHIIRLFTLGLLGEKRSRRIVPTRWAITAVDSIVGNNLLKSIRTFRELDEYRLYYTQYIGNRYVILMAPGSWSFEMVEIWLPRSIWVKAKKAFIAVNYELSNGRPRRPEVDGGYHAIRMPILEGLYRERRQATVIVIREVTPEYYAPVGSWQIRESIRRALERPMVKPVDLKSALKYIERLIETDISEIFKKSFLLKHLTRQERLDKFMNL